MENQLLQIGEKGEIVLCQPDDSVRLEVKLQDETVWLTQQQMTCAKHSVLRIIQIVCFYSDPSETYIGKIAYYLKEIK